jgi:hypothetical protein
MMGYWQETLGSNGQFKSGQTAEDSARYVRDRCWAHQREATINILEGERGRQQQPATMTTGDDDDDEDNGNDTRDPSKMPSTFSPSGYLSFMIFGPYCVAVFGTKHSNFFSFDCDAVALDGKVKGGKGGRAQVRMDEKARDDLESSRRPPRCGIRGRSKWARKNENGTRFHFHFSENSVWSGRVKPKNGSIPALPGVPGSIVQEVQEVQEVRKCKMTKMTDLPTENGKRPLLQRNPDRSFMNIAVQRYPVGDRRRVLALSRPAPWHPHFVRPYPQAALKSTSSD